MWIKLIGAGMLLACGGLWAGAQTRAERAEITRVAAFGDLFARIGEQIETLCLPLDEILSHTPAEAIAACGCEGVGRAVLRPAAERIEDTAAREILVRAVGQLGRGSREDQVKLCRGTAEALKVRSEKLAGEAERSARARGTLVMTACLGGIILLW